MITGELFRADRIAPAVGFPVTICVVCYGPHSQLAKRFLDQLYLHTNPELFTLRAGLNEVEAATLDHFEACQVAYGNIKLFVEPSNIFKVPLMHRLFRQQPIESQWVIWFDDDSYVTRADWLPRLAGKIQHHPHVSQWGKIYSLWQEGGEFLKFIEQSSWYRGVPLRREANGKGSRFEFRFATGGFWAARSAVIRELDWPDLRARQGHEDYLLGEALRQNGHEIGSHHYGVAVNQEARRNPDAPEFREFYASAQ